MNKKEYLFYDKVNFIYHTIAKNSLKEFTNLFYIKENKASFENRKSYLSKKWLHSKEKTVFPRMFKGEYDKYKFSSLDIHGKRIFDNADEFMEIDIEFFLKRIKEYIRSQVELTSEEEMQYHYMYIFNMNGIENNPWIDYYKIEYNKTLLPNEISITVTPPQHKESLEIAPYHGTIKYKNNKIILIFENHSDYISTIFNTDLMSDHSKYLVGMGIGIADINQKIPIAKKVILSKRKLENLDELYLILNESEILSTDENLYDYKYHDRDVNASHFDKYAKKIDRLHHLFTNLSKQNIYNDFYYQLGFKELSAVNHIFQKLTKKHSYYINYRKRVLDILLKSHPQEQYQKLTIVMPVYQDDNIFEHQSPQALQLQKELKLLSSSVEIEMIFVIDDCREAFSYEFMRFLEAFQKQIKIYFTLKKNIENEVNSIDFLFTDKENFVVTKSLRVNTSVFNLYHDKSTINEHEAMYRKIRNRSISYEEFFKQGVTICQSHNPILKNLVGKWYFHFYGTQKLWIGEMDVSKEGTVTVISENGDMGKGEIIHKSHQSVILLEDIRTHRLVTVTFDHQPYKIAHAFTVQVISKQFKSDMEILTIGIVSRHQIEMEKFQEILGDVDEVRILEKENVQKRLSEYLAGVFYL